MSKPQKVELEALEQAGLLLKFAAENAKQLPAELAATLAASWEARDSDKWSTEIAAKFWGAYNSLCQLIKPVSLDTLQSNIATIPCKRWLFLGETKAISPAKSTVQFYLAFLILGLIVAIGLQFIVSTSATLTEDIDAILKENTKHVAKIESDLNSIPDAKDLPETALSLEQRKTISTINDLSKEVLYGLDRIRIKQALLSKMTKWSNRGSDYKPDIPEFKTVNQVRGGLNSYYMVRTNYVLARESNAFTVRVYNSAVLPLLLGLVGACAYVTRLISDQIKDSTFSSTSPVRHLVRVALGALAGVIVGFGWFTSGTSSGSIVGFSASTLALAFAAGYAIEPVFATVDSIAEKFRKSA